VRKVALFFSTSAVERSTDYSDEEKKILSVEEKFEVIRVVENGKQKADICREFGLVNSAIQIIWENTAKIINAFERNVSRIKRFRKPEQLDVGEALLKWF
jgi:hypothetical protein